MENTYHVDLSGQSAPSWAEVPKVLTIPSEHQWLESDQSTSTYIKMPTILSDDLRIAQREKSVYEAFLRMLGSRTDRILCVDYQTLSQKARLSYKTTVVAVQTLGACGYLWVKTDHRRMKNGRNTYYLPDLTTKTIAHDRSGFSCEEHDHDLDIYEDSDLANEFWDDLSQFSDLYSGMIAETWYEGVFQNEFGKDYQPVCYSGGEESGDEYEDGDEICAAHERLFSLFTPEHEVADPLTYSQKCMIAQNIPEPEIDDTIAMFEWLFTQYHYRHPYRYMLKAITSPTYAKRKQWRDHTQRQERIHERQRSKLGETSERDAAEALQREHDAFIRTVSCRLEESQLTQLQAYLAGWAGRLGVPLQLKYISRLRPEDIMAFSTPVLYHVQRWLQSQNIIEGSDVVAATDLERVSA
jgi:hypothetical protein